MLSTTSLALFQYSYYHFSGLAGDIGNSEVKILPRAPEGAKLIFTQDNRYIKIRLMIARLTMPTSSCSDGVCRSY